MMTKEEKLKRCHPFSPEASMTAKIKCICGRTHSFRSNTPHLFKCDCGRLAGISFTPIFYDKDGLEIVIE
jgi:hypothetical protein